MNNDDLLKNIQKLFETERAHTRKLIREEVGGVEKHLTEKIASVDLKVDGVEKHLTAKIEGVDMKVEALNHKLDITAKEIKDEINETIEREAKASADAISDILDRQENLEKRTKRIETNLNLPQL